MNKYVDYLEKKAAGFENAIEGATNLFKSTAKATGRAANSPAGEKVKSVATSAKNSPAGKTLSGMVIPGVSVGATGAYVNNKMSDKSRQRAEEARRNASMATPVVYPAIVDIAKTYQ